MAPRKNSFAVSSKGHFYNVPKSDLLVADVATVQVGCEVRFKYGKSEYDGVVRSEAATEKEVSEIIKALKKDDKRASRPPSFDASQPRRAAVKQREMLLERLGKKATASDEKPKTPKQLKHQAKRNQKMAREKAAIAMENEIDPNSKSLGAGTGDDGHQDSEESVESDSSSVESDDEDSLLRSLAKKSGASKDTAAVRETVYSDDTSGDDREAEPSVPLKRKHGDSEILIDPKKGKTDQLDDSTLSTSPASHSPGINTDVTTGNATNSNDFHLMEQKDAEKSRQAEGSLVSSKSAGNNEPQTPSQQLLQDSQNGGGNNKSVTPPLHHKVSDKTKKRDKSKKKKKGGKKKKSKKNERSRTKRVYGSDEDSEKEANSGAKEDDPSDEEDESTKKGSDAKEQRQGEKERMEENDEKNEDFGAKGEKPEEEDGMSGVGREVSADEGEKGKKLEEEDGRDDGREEDRESKHKDKKKMKRSKHKKKKMQKRKKNVKRNMDVYPGLNYLHSKQPGCTKLHADYNVYVKKSEYEELLKAPTATRFVRGLVDKVYTKEALMGSTPQGFPPRGKGKQCYGEKMLPRLHPDGLNAIIAAAKAAEEDNRTWRPRSLDKNLKSAFSVRCCELKSQWALSSSESESDSDSSSSSSSNSSDSSSTSSSP